MFRANWFLDPLLVSSSRVSILWEWRFAVTAHLRCLRTMNKAGGQPQATSRVENRKQPCPSQCPGSSMAGLAVCGCARQYRMSRPRYRSLRRNVHRHVPPASGRCNHPSGLSTPRGGGLQLPPLPCPLTVSVNCDDPEAWAMIPAVFLRYDAFKFITGPSPSERTVVCPIRSSLGSLSGSW